MLLYHMSQTLKVGDKMTPDRRNSSELARPFVQALGRGEDCFLSMVLCGKYMFAVLKRSGLREWADYAKWATEGAFEFVRKTQFPDCCGRLSCNYFYDDLPNCKRLFEYDYGGETEEERQKVRLFEVEVDDPAPQRRDMKLYDEAYDAMSETQDLSLVLARARSYWRGEHTPEPVWELLSDKPAVAVRDITEYLK